MVAAAAEAALAGGVSGASEHACPRRDAGRDVARGERVRGGDAEAGVPGRGGELLRHGHAADAGRDPATAHARKRVLTLAAGSFTVVGGKIAAVTLRLSARARALLARMHVLRVQAVIVAHDPAGATHTTQAIVTLRLGRALHRR